MQILAPTFWFTLESHFQHIEISWLLININLKEFCIFILVQESANYENQKEFCF